MKKTISFLLLGIILFTSIPTNADANNNTTQGKIITYVNSDDYLEDFLRENGLSEKNIKRTLLKKEEVIKKLKTRQNDNIQILKELGFSDNEISVILDNGISVDLKEQNIEKLKTEIEYQLELNTTDIDNSNDNSEIDIRSSYGGDHIVYGAVSAGILSERSSTVRFHYDSLPTEYGLVCRDIQEEREGFLWKLEVLELAMVATESIAAKLYNVNDPINEGIRFNYNVYGEKTGSSVYHEGIDFANKAGVDIYAPSNAQYLNHGTYSTGLTYVNVYIPKTQQTICYEHLNFNTDLLNKLKKYDDVGGKIIGYESNNGTKSPHTHVEIKEGEDLAPEPNGDNDLSCTSPYYTLQEIYYN